jgi:hypothetical protein
MVNLATLNYLPELQQWEAQIPRLEDGWWPTGGAVNPAADGGLMNWQAGLLANRTAFLKGVIDGAGLGAAAVPLVTLNSAAARLTGSYRFASGDANTPASGVAGTVEVIAASASAVNQMAFDSASSRMWTRFWNGTVWSAWSEIWRTTGVAESQNNPGWQRLPSGLILQWGQNSVAANGNQAITFPLAFPFFCFSFVATLSNTITDLTTQFTPQLRGLTATTATLRNIGTTTQDFLWLAIGR